MKKMPEKDELMKILLTKFKPEFINRIDEIVPFNQLSIQVVKEIVDLELKKLAKRILDNIKANLFYKEDVLSYIANKAYNPAFGARVVKRFIQNQIENKIADFILSNEIKEDSIITINIEDDEIVIKVK